MIAITWDPSSRVLRQFAGIACLVLAAMALAAHGRSPTVRIALACGAAAVGLTAWRRPQHLRLPYVVLTLVVAPLGAAMSHLVLGVLFFGVVTPLGLLARLWRPDPLEMRPNRRVQTDWRTRGGSREASRYLRQS